MTVAVKWAASFARDAALALVVLFVAVASVYVDSSSAAVGEAAPASGGAVQHGYDARPSSTTSPTTSHASAGPGYDEHAHGSHDHPRASRGVLATKGGAGPVRVGQAGEANVGSLCYSSQLRDYAAIAQREGYRFDLYMRRSTELSGPQERAIAGGNINLRYLP